MSVMAQYALTTQYNAININSLVRRGLFPGKHAQGEIHFSGGGSVRFEVHGDYVSFQYSCGGRMNGWSIYTETTPTNFNGRRRWFRCPSCGRRAGVMYFSSCGPQCRRCLHLIYPTSREKRMGKAVIKRNRLYHALGAEPMQRIATIKKPKGMHWKTFERKKDELLAAQEAVVGAMGASLEYLRRRVGSL